MAYLQIDDGFADHPKIDDLSDAAFRAHVRALCHCAKHLTDGTFPKTAGERFARPKVRKELLTSGLWVEVPGGYEIHDYLDWNDSREKVLARRESKRAAGAMGAASRYASSKRMARGVGEVLVGSGEGPEDQEEAAFQRFYQACPRRVAPGRARKAFRAALKKTDADTIQAGIEAYAISVEGVEPTFIAHPASWLTGERWQDEAQRPQLSLADQAKRMRGTA
jgi:hypothetical protein